MNERESTIQIARITAAIASGEILEEAGQQAIDEIRRLVGLQDNVVLDVAQVVGSHAFGIGSGAADIAEVAVGSVFDLFDD